MKPLGRPVRLPARGLSGASFGRAWRSVRPTTHRGAIGAAIAIAAGSVALAAVFLVGAAMAWSPYIETDLHSSANANMWAGQELAFAGGGQCSRCHQTETTKAASARHAGIGCESCHGALLDHAGSDGQLASSAKGPALPTDSVCIRCHAIALGRPAGLLQIDSTAHYVPLCLQCHDPHTGISRRPPVVLHPLDGLPACAVCHGPDGFKARSLRHPDVTSDVPCLSCHAEGRGPRPGS